MPAVSILKFLFIAIAVVATELRDTRKILSYVFVFFVFFFLFHLCHDLSRVSLVSRFRQDIVLRNFGKLKSTKTIVFLNYTQSNIKIISSNFPYTNARFAI